MILALETVFEQCSVALLRPDGAIVAANTLQGNRQQTQQILPMIQDMLTTQQLAFNELTAIAFNRGPGAFSGIRINTAVAQAIAFAHDLPCLPVSSLQTLAQQAFIEQQLTHVYAAIDARMNQVYAGEFKLKDNIMQPVSEHSETLLDYGVISEKNLPIVGNGAPLLTHYSDQLVINDILPTAVMIGQLGAAMLIKGLAVPAGQALPVYLRHNAWKTLAEQKA